MSAKFIFDVDGVLCDRGQPINDQFRWWLEDFLIDKDYYLVTGSHREKTATQIGRLLAHGPRIGFHCLGNSIWTENGVEVVINTFDFSKIELDHLKAFYTYSVYNNKQHWGDVLERRSGSYNYSLAVRGGTVEERQHYVEHDNLYRERENFIIQLANTFPRFDAYIGGDCSIDIVLRGANKGQIINSLDIDLTNEEVYFFGDRYGPYGIDKPLADGMVSWIDSTVFEINKGYKETWEILKSLKTE
jgi:hydroxymethylpyrimidine pyrophosphatase-like HAD family hydrolase